MMLALRTPSATTNRGRSDEGVVVVHATSRMLSVATEPKMTRRSRRLLASSLERCAERTLQSMAGPPRR
jgi:hypothetical protein